jgi:Family of unknown function (DUF6247)
MVPSLSPRATIVIGMTTAAVDIPFATASPAEIRKVLLPEELPQFEEQYRQALRVAAETFSLDKLNATMERWRRIAWMTHSDPEAHRRMLDKARRILAGEQLPSVSAEEMRARLQERLGR